MDTHTKFLYRLRDIWGLYDNLITEMNTAIVSTILKDWDKNDLGIILQVLWKIGYPRNQLAIDDVFETLQDTNWPGVTMYSFRILGSIFFQDKSYIIRKLEAVLVTAFLNKDYEWIRGLSELVDFIPINRDDFISKDLYEILDLTDNFEFPFDEKYNRIVEAFIKLNSNDNDGSVNR